MCVFSVVLGVCMCDVMVCGVVCLLVCNLNLNCVVSVLMLLFMMCVVWCYVEDDVVDVCEVNIVVIVWVCEWCEVLSVGWWDNVLFLCVCLSVWLFCVCVLCWCCLWMSCVLWCLCWVCWVREFWLWMRVWGWLESGLCWLVLKMWLKIELCCVNCFLVCWGLRSMLVEWYCLMKCCDWWGRVGCCLWRCCDWEAWRRVLKSTRGRERSTRCWMKFLCKV